MTIKRISIILIIAFTMFSLLACASYDKNSELIFRELYVKYVGDFVTFSYKYNDDYSSMDQYKEVYLVFVGDNYIAKNSNSSNDYYIIDTNEKVEKVLSPLELSVGDRLAFLSYEKQTIDDFIVGTYLSKMVIRATYN